MYNRWYAVLQAFIWVFMKIFHPWQATGLENLPEGGVMMCGNHTTIGDPFYVVCSLGFKKQTHIMAKNELMEIPVLGWLLKKSGIIGVRRGEADVKAIKECMKHLKDGRRLLLFPEGTRVREGEESHAHTGAAMLATRTGVPLLPIYIQPEKKLFRKVKVVFGEPYYPRFEGRKPTPEEYQKIADDLMDRIRALGGTVSCK
ncbi:MAG TPA: 1-acyl-sn-glycerol-3-phosphate acyltransferase [Clostridiales bacterium]|nr:1-acyl-sn-glycerol-3-phosphate acyltransferase [Clostridiales bacterium]